jgi:mRNA interferase MazF
MFTPGDVILVDFPGVQGVKPRPGIVVSSAAYHLARPDVVVGLCTSKVASATAPTDYRLQDWAAAGLKVPTAYRSFFATVPVREVHRVIGHVSDRDWAEIQARLRLALAVT